MKLAEDSPGSTSGRANENAAEVSGDRLKCFRETEAAALLGLSVHTLRRMRYEGRGPNFVKYSGANRKGHGQAGRVVYRRADLAEYQDRNLVVTET